MMALGVVRSGLLVVVVVGLLHFAASDVAAGGLFPTAFRLERAALPRAPGGRIKVDELVSRDRSRHGRLLLSSVSAVSDGSGGGGVVNFPVEGSGDPFTVGLYYTTVKLGNPAKEFYVQIDTGSDILWVTCASCTGCPTSSGLGITLESFDPSKSSTSSAISCSDKRCGLSSQTSEAVCSNSQCGYTFQYGDGSGTSGYYVSDTLYFGSVMPDESISNSSTPVVFGCSNSQSGDLTKPDRAVDGIFGFGQNGMSVISQLSSQGVAPKVFSHCLKGTDNGGGILVLGHIVEPGITYTPLVQSQPHYNLNLLSIAVNGNTLSIDSSVFSTSSNQGTIVDSGTTLAYLADKAYDPFVNAIIAAVPQSVRSVVLKGMQCFVTVSSADAVFPSVVLNFEGSASMNIKPDDYLLPQGSVNGEIIYCIGWQKNEGSGITILGDLVLKDKVFVYDLEAQRIGWASYDCSLPVNVSSSSPTGRNEFVNTGQMNTNTAPSRPNLIQLGVLAFAVNLIVTGISRL